MKGNDSVRNHIVKGRKVWICRTCDKSIEQGCNFDTSPEALKKLQSQGVPEAVILAMFHAKKRGGAR